MEVGEKVEKHLEGLFKKFGILKDVRLVTFRNGKISY